MKMFGLLQYMIIMNNVNNFFCYFLSFQNFILQFLSFISIQLRNMFTPIKGYESVVNDISDETYTDVIKKINGIFDSGQTNGFIIDNISKFFGVFLLRYFERCLFFCFCFIIIII